MLEKLFKFPIIRLDEQTEDKKEMLGLPSDEGQYDIIVAEAEYPYYDFMGIEDGWTPSEKGVQDAVNGVFDACVVKFANIPQLLVPWTKEKFKRELKKFSDKVNKIKEGSTEIKVVNIPIEKLQQLFEEPDSSKDKEDE